jgi:hypothetical protein
MQQQSKGMLSMMAKRYTDVMNDNIVVPIAPATTAAATAAATNGPVVSIHNNEDNTVERMYQQHTKQWQKKTTSTTTTTIATIPSSISDNKVIPEFMRMRLRKSTTAAHPYDIKEEVSNDMNRKGTTPTTTHATLLMLQY